MTQVLKIALASTIPVSGFSANDIVKGSGTSFPYSVPLLFVAYSLSKNTYPKRFKLFPIPVFLAIIVSSDFPCSV